jgi:photosystem II stability/assembly factor-like uncharacterized protein
MRFVFPALLLCALFEARAEDRWKIQFFYDKPDAVFDIRDLACPSAARCIGAGVIGDMKDRVKGATVVTSDGGRRWTMEDFADEPVSLFFLPETRSAAGVGWIAARHGIWKTEEGGRSWKKIAALRGIVQMHFLDPMHGFAIGYPKAIYETKDGGSTWTKPDAAQLAPGKADNIVYQCIAFDGQQGVVLGKPVSQRPGQYPIWMTPNAERHRQQKESPVFMLQTLDGGKTWKFDTGALAGDITELSFTKDKHVLALMEYHDLYTFPSAVIRINLGAPGREAVFERKDRAVRALAVLEDGSVLMAAVEPPGNTNQVPVPGKLKVLRSVDLKNWHEMDVDYRADAQHATIAAPDGQHAWVATDTGMILGLEAENPSPQKQLQ